MLALALLVPALAGATPRPEELAARYSDLLLFKPSDYSQVDIAEGVLRRSVLPMFRRAVRKVTEFSYERGDQKVYFVSQTGTAAESAANQAAVRTANNAFLELFSEALPVVAYAYSTPGTASAPNPYYRDPELAQLYVRALEYCYSRGMTESAWMPDHAGRASRRALSEGLVRPSGDLSTVSLRFGGFIQGIFLMREVLAGARLLDKYRAVVRNMVVNHGVMYPAFFPRARREAAVIHEYPLPVEDWNHLNADGVRLFVDYFWPYFLLIDDPAERSQMSGVLARVIAANVAVKPGTQGIIKPDGTAFHHAAAYMGSYGPYALEAFAQLLYLAKGLGCYTPENVAAVRLALESYRAMVQKYSVTPALQGRLIGPNGERAATAISKAMAFLAHPEGANDFAMQARLREFFDRPRLWPEAGRHRYFEGQRGVPIRGFGIYRMLADLLGPGKAAAPIPEGVWIKPYAAAAFFRRGDWLVTAKGFSQYFWDFEAPLRTRENSFGQNWPYGLLQVFSAGSPVSALGSGYDLDNGWDWYHVPGTTASHYPIESRTRQGVQELQRAQGIRLKHPQRNYNSKTFVGGVTLGDHGLFAQDLEGVPFIAPTDLRARKTYFFVGDRVLALGTDIHGGTPTHATHTAIFQTRLAEANAATGLNGTTLTGLGVNLREPGSRPATMVDSVGNSYFLAASTADLVVTRSLQKSMSEEFEANEGAFAQAYLDHGMRPEGHSYQYVLIPADEDARKLQELAGNPGAYYRIVQSDGMHLVRFPAHGISGYAFYELVETPPGEFVRSASHHAAVIVQQGADSVRMAASVPDIGWRFNKERIAVQGVDYGSERFERQVAPPHTLELVLRGKWCLSDSQPGTEVAARSGDTALRLQVRDGLGAEVGLIDGGACP